MNMQVAASSSTGPGPDARLERGAWHASTGGDSQSAARHGQTDSAVVPGKAGKTVKRGRKTATEGRAQVQYSAHGAKSAADHPLIIRGARRRRAGGRAPRRRPRCARAAPTPCHPTFVPHPMPAAPTGHTPHHHPTHRAAAAAVTYFYVPRARPAPTSPRVPPPVTPRPLPRPLCGRHCLPSLAGCSEPVA